MSNTDLDLESPLLPLVLHVDSIDTGEKVVGDFLIRLVLSIVASHLILIKKIEMFITEKYIINIKTGVTGQRCKL